MLDLQVPYEHQKSPEPYIGPHKSIPRSQDSHDGVCPLAKIRPNNFVIISPVLYKIYLLRLFKFILFSFVIIQLEKQKKFPFLLQTNMN